MKSYKIETLDDWIALFGSTSIGSILLSMLDVLRIVQLTQNKRLIEITLRLLLLESLIKIFWMQREPKTIKL